MRSTAIHLLTLAVILALPLAARAQNSAFTATQQSMAFLPGDVENLTIVDGDLYCYGAGILLKAQRSGEQIVGFWPDTTFVRINPGVNYVVQHPTTGDIYFTAPDKKGRSRLFCRHVDEKGRVKVKRLKMNGVDVAQPTFTTDGHIMIFASLDKRHSYGGYDLWYSTLEGGKWSRPANLGDRVNTEGEEHSPSIYRDCLLFASNGHPDADGSIGLYSTRLVSEKRLGDTVYELQVGRCRVQRLPEDINSPDADNFDMVVDTARGCAYWVSNRDASDAAPLIFSLSGNLDGVLLWGQVLDKLDNRLEGVRVTAMQSGINICNTVTDADGFYRLYLQSNQYYELSFQLDDYFVDYEQVNTAKADDEYLIGDARQDVVMDKLLLDQKLHYYDLFGPNADVELSDYGIETLEPLLQFLLDNPAMSVSLTLQCDLTDDATFNHMLTEERIKTLQRHFYRRVPSSVQMSFSNGCNAATANASGNSRLMVVISK